MTQFFTDFRLKNLHDFSSDLFKKYQKNLTSGLFDKYVEEINKKVTELGLDLTLIDIWGEFIDDNGNVSNSSIKKYFCIEYNDLIITEFTWH